MNYDEFTLLTRSQKVTLAVIKAKQRLKNFTNVSGSTWTRITPYYVSNVAGASFSFDPVTSTLTLTSAVNPNTLNIVVEYSFFFSDFPVNRDVEYQARLIEIGALKLELDTENTGIALETDSSIKLENTDGYFDSIFDRLIWENQECLFYSWSPVLPWSERRLIYKGYISTKAFNSGYVSFSIKDSFVKLRDKIPFTGTRLIYGKAKNLNCSSTDKVGTGFRLNGLLSGRDDRDLLSGVLSGTATTNTITGVGTHFSTELVSGDKIRVIDGLVEYSYTVDVISSNTSMTISGTISNTFSGSQGRNASISNNIITGVSTVFLDQVSPDDELTINDIKYKVESIQSDGSLTTQEQVKTAFTSLTATNVPAINYRAYNRSQNVSGHLLADYTTSIDTVISQRTFSVFDISHIYDGDIIEIDSFFYTVERVSGNIITLNQTALSTLSSGAPVEKPSIQRVSFGDADFVHGRDFIEENLTGGCRVILNDEAEFNIASEIVSSVSFLFTVGSRTVTSLSNSVDLTGIFQPRDWIKGYTGSTISWYEILAVDQTVITLRHSYGETRNFTGPALYRKPVYIGDDSLVLVDCLGKKSDTGVWLKTASDATKDICQQIGINTFDEASFANSKLDAPYCLNLVYPESIGQDMPIARDAILAINKSVFGSLYSNSNFEIAYSILNADRDEAPVIINDEDILSFSTSTKNQITNSIVSTYRKELGTDASQSYTFSNDNVTGITTTLDLELALYNQADVEIVTQRYALMRSSAQSTVSIKGKLNLISKTLNDRIYLSLDRLFKRFGSSGNMKIGLVNMISKNSTTVDLQINDLGNLFGRVGSIAPNTALDFTSATDEEISRYTYIVDNDTETPDTTSDESLGANLIG